ncbi:MAG: Spy/CpxP family protein refolding chaperone [Gemmatimonadales bacterium]
MRNAILLSVIGLGFVVPAQAQRRPGGAGGQDRQLVNFASVVIEHREELNLNDDQLVALEEIRVRLEEQNGPYRDSIQQMRQRMFSGSGGGGARPDRSQMQRVRERMAPWQRQMQQNSEAAQEAIMAILDDDQRNRVQDLAREMRRQQQRRPGQDGQRGRRGGRRPGGRRPR